ITDCNGTSCRAKHAPCQLFTFPKPTRDAPTRKNAPLLTEAGRFEVSLYDDRRGRNLATQTEALNERTVTVDVDVLQVTQHAATLADEQQQATTRVVVVLVRLEVLGQVLNALREHCNLNLGGTGVTGLGRVL